jgi:pimeloyl-ACP methyl ester carboxylesterase
MEQGLYLEIGEERFYYRVWGDRGPVLHFAHATGFNGATYGPLAEMWKRDFRVFALDQRGHGKTSAHADPASLRDWKIFRDDLEAFFQALGGEVIAAGHSMGAVASMLLAVKRPDLVKALILIDPTILPYSWMWWWYLAKKTGLARFVPIAYRAARRNPVWPDRETILNIYRRKGSFSLWEKGFLETYVEGGTVDDPSGGVRLACSPAWEARIFATCPHDIWRYVPLVRQPVLVIYGGKSDTFLPSAARRFKKLSPDAEMVCLQGCGHFVPMERPLEAALGIERFLGEKLRLKKMSC